MIDSNFPQLNDPEWIKSQLNQGNGTAEMARIIGCHYTAVTRAIKRHGLQEYNKRTKYPQLNDADWLANEIKTKSYRLIAKELGTSAGNVADHAYRLKIASPSGNRSEAVRASLKKRYPEGRFGKDASNYKGGRRTINGYVAIFSPDHPDKTTGDFVFEHRLMMEKSLGRSLTKKEIVHHLDLTKNNDISNFYLCADRAEHKNLHHQLELIGAEFYRRGHVGFRDGAYYIRSDEKSR